MTFHGWKSNVSYYFLIEFLLFSPCSFLAEEKKINNTCSRQDLQIEQLRSVYIFFFSIEGLYLTSISVIVYIISFSMTS